MRVVAESHVKFIESAERDFRTEEDSPQDVPPAAPQPRPGVEERAPQKPSNLFEALASGSKPAAGPAETLPGINDILDRLSQGQRETLASQPQPQPRREANPPAPPASDGTASSEWNMDQFRRDLQNIVGNPNEPGNNR
jgi:hypothetical protein